MLTPATYTIETAAPRVLRPTRALYRLRPVAFRLVARELAWYSYTYRAAKLLDDLFPEEAPQVPVTNDWWDILATVLNLCEERDWFLADWGSEISGQPPGILDQLWEGWMSSGEDEYRDDMAAYLTGIPVRLYGFTESDIEETYGLMVLCGLISDQVTLSADSLVELELYDILTETTKEELLHRCLTTDWSHLPEPLCWLGEMAGIVASCTGNILLDNKNDLWEGIWPDQFTWEADLEAVKEAWVTAKPVAQHRRRFIDWLWEDEENTRTMAYTILGLEEL